MQREGRESFCRDRNVSQLFNYLPYKLLTTFLWKPRVKNKKKLVLFQRTQTIGPKCHWLEYFTLCLCVKWGHTYKKCVSIPPKKSGKRGEKLSTGCCEDVFSSLGRCYLLCRAESWKIWTELSYSVSIWLKNYLVDKCRIIDWNPLAKRAHKHLNNGPHIFFHWSIKERIQ